MSAGSSRGLVGRFVRDRRGNFAMMFGLLLVPLASMIGAAVDYSRASNAKTHLTAAADAAALAAVSLNAMALDKKDAATLAEAMFRDRAAQAKFATNVDVTVKVKDTSSLRTTSVAFSASVPTLMMRIVGWQTMPVQGTATASSVPPVYIDFHMLLDNTPSMGVAATTADIAKMVAGTPDQCAFACHDLSAAGKDYYALAKSLGVTMRIDVVRSATQQLMDTATTTAIVPGQYRAAVSTFGATCGTPGIAAVTGLTSNLASVKTSANAIDLMTTPFQNYNNDQCTDFDGALTTTNLTIGTPGDGLKASEPQKVLFLVSDGVSDSFKPAGCAGPTTSGRCQEPVNLATCTAIKNRGIRIAVLYTTYLPLPTNSWYVTWIGPFAANIPSKMEACASPGLYFEVGPSQGIAEAMVALFRRSIATARLSA